MRARTGKACLAASFKILSYVPHIGGIMYRICILSPHRVVSLCLGDESKSYAQIYKKRVFISLPIHVEGQGGLRCGVQLDNQMALGEW